jgi:glycerol-3-phosphate dehydrogenase [NAD(P)+]
MVKEKKNNMAKITIIGSGAMGSACANILVDNRHNVTIYGINQNELDDLQNGKNSKYFGDIELNKFKTTSNLKEALDKTEFVVLAIPTKFIASVYQDILNNLNSKIVIINVCKGF